MNETNEDEVINSEPIDEEGSEEDELEEQIINAQAPQNELKLNGTRCYLQTQSDGSITLEINSSADSCLNIVNYLMQVYSQVKELKQMKKIDYCGWYLFKIFIHKEFIWIENHI